MQNIVSIQKIGEFFLGWPLNIYVIFVGVACTVAFCFVQLRYLPYALSSIFASSDKTTKTADMTPLQAFINTLSTNLGNGSIAGMATAISLGGPGAAIWILIIGLLLMSVRFAEVFLSVNASKHAVQNQEQLGGPMLYLQDVMGGKYLAGIYAYLCLFFGLLIGIGMQTNSIRISICTTWGISPLITASILTLFIVYIVCGGSQRIVALSDKIVPLKVVVFFVSVFIVLAYHYHALIPALSLMISGAFTPLAVTGGAVGFSVQQAMRYGIQRSIFATESGLGTAAILYASTGSKEPVRAGLVSMLSTLISTIVCFLIALSIVASGVWNNGMGDISLTIAAFATVFGWAAGWIVSFLSVTFGIGVLVSFTYICQKAWLSITHGRFQNVFYITLCLVGFFGAMLDAKTVFSMGDYLLAAMLLINLFGIAYLIPVIKKCLSEFRKTV